VSDYSVGPNLGQDTLAQRQLIAEEHRSASKTAIAKKRQIEKLKSSSNISRDRVDEALDEYDEAEKHQVLLTQKLTAISQRLAPSLTNHTQQMHEDLFAALGTHARAGLAYERQALKDLEQLRKDVKAIPKISSKEGAGSYYVHPASISASPSVRSPPMSSPALSSHSRASSVSTPATRVEPDLVAPPRRTASAMPTQDRMAQSMFVPPSQQAPPAAPDMSKSVMVDRPSGPLDPAKARTLVDERRRVDARAAASKLANMF
jgi:hypothetical protein